jgi:AraC-like DNA-binding protein
MFVILRHSRKPDYLMAINREKHTMPTAVVSPPSLPQGYARIAPIHALGRLIRLQGGDPDAVFRAAKIDDRDLSSPDGVLPVALRGELMERAVQETGCEHFGLLLGAQSGIRELGAAGQLMLELPTVGEALDAFVAFWLLHNPSGIVFVRRSGDQASFGYAVIDGNIPGMSQLQDSAMTFALNIMRDMLGAHWRPTGVSLMRREPRNPAFHLQFLGGPCRFNAIRSELIFPAATLDFRLKNSVARTTDVAQRPTDGHDWSAYVQRLAYRLLLQGECSQKRVASELGVSDRTLVRKLGSSGVTYQELFEGARYSVSRSLIRDTNLTLAEIAAALGYKEASSFSRAFQRWSGMSPAQWRKLKVERG